MKILSKLSKVLALTVAAALIFAVPAKAATPEEVYLLQQMQLQQQANLLAQQYFLAQQAAALADGRKVSDIEMVKRQALEGMIVGNNGLLAMGNHVLSVGQPAGEANIAIMDDAARQGMISGYQMLEDIKKRTWMQYTFRAY